MANELSELLERVKAATGPDWEINMYIEWALGDWDNLGGHRIKHKVTGEERQTSYPPSPPITSSIDAALALVDLKLPGWARYISKHDGEYFCSLWLENPEDNTTPLHSAEATGKSDPLAILAALLTALLNTKENGE